MYKQALQQKLKFNTPVGIISLDRVFDLSITQLAESIRLAKAEIKETNIDEDLSFLNSTVVVNTDAKLRFDILKDVYLTKQKAIEDQKAAANVKAYNQKIDEYIALKEEDKLRNLSIDELKKLRQ